MTVARNLKELNEKLEAERDENTCRLDFAPSEAVRLGEQLEKLEKPKAKQRHGGDHKGNSGKFPELGRTRDVVGRAVGMSGKTYEAAKNVIEAAKADPAPRVSPSG